jgi:acyl dehydratase
MIEWLDDLKLGMRFTSSETTVSREDIKRFAAEFDPQPFHLDEGSRREERVQGACDFGVAHRRDRDESRVVGR